MPRPPCCLTYHKSYVCLPCLHLKVENTRNWWPCFYAESSVQRQHSFTGTVGISRGQVVLCHTSMCWMFPGYYHQAIMMSGTDLSLNGVVKPFYRPGEYAKMLAAKVNCPSKDSYSLVSCMRDNNTVKWEDIVQAQKEIQAHVSFSCHVHFPNFWGQLGSLSISTTCRTWCFMFGMVRCETITARGVQEKCLPMIVSPVQQAAWLLSITVTAMINA